MGGNQTGWGQVGWKEETRHKLVHCHQQVSATLIFIETDFRWAVRAGHEVDKLSVSSVAGTTVQYWHWSDPRAESELTKDRLHLKMKLGSITSLLLVNCLPSLTLDQMKMTLSERKFIPRLFEAEKIEVTKHMWWCGVTGSKTHPGSGGKNACCTQLFGDPGMQIEQVWLVHVPWTRAGICGIAVTSYTPGGLF